MPLADKVIMITGAAHRVGAQIARTLHAQGARLVLHYNRSESAAQALKADLETERADSVALVQGDLLNIAALPAIIRQAERQWKRLDALINNASTFYPTTIGSITETQWEDLMGTNIKAPLFLSQAAAPLLQASRGCIVNIVDIHADRPLKAYPVYSIAKAGLVMLTKSLARELGPHVRVNAVAPGAILWPEHGLDDETRHQIISQTALKRQGSPDDIAKAVSFLIKDADYTSGHVLTVDGGRSLGH